MGVECSLERLPLVEKVGFTTLQVRLESELLLPVRDWCRAES